MPLQPLPDLCAQAKEETGPRAYRGIVRASEHVQMGIALRCIQQMQYVRDAFSRITEHLEDTEIEEIAARQEQEERGDQFVRFYSGSSRNPVANSSAVPKPSSVSRN